MSEKSERLIMPSLTQRISLKKIYGSENFHLTGMHLFPFLRLDFEMHGSYVTFVCACVVVKLYKCLETQYSICILSVYEVNKRIKQTQVCLNS